MTELDGKEKKESNKWTFKLTCSVIKQYSVSYDVSQFFLSINFKCHYKQKMIKTFFLLRKNI